MANYLYPPKLPVTFGAVAARQIPSGKFFILDNVTLSELNSADDILVSDFINYYYILISLDDGDNIYYTSGLYVSETNSVEVAIKETIFPAINFDTAIKIKLSFIASDCPYSPSLYEDTYDWIKNNSKYMSEWSKMSKVIFLRDAPEIEQFSTGVITSDLLDISDHFNFQKNNTQESLKSIDIKIWRGDYLVANTGKIECESNDYGKILLQTSKIKTKLFNNMRYNIDIYFETKNGFSGMNTFECYTNFNTDTTEKFKKLLKINELVLPENNSNNILIKNLFTTERFDNKLVLQTEQQQFNVGAAVVIIQQYTTPKRLDEVISFLNEGALRIEDGKVVGDIIFNSLTPPLKGLEISFGEITETATENYANYNDIFGLGIDIYVRPQGSSETEVNKRITFTLQEEEGDTFKYKLKALELYRSEVKEQTTEQNIDLIKSVNIGDEILQDNPILTVRDITAEPGIFYQYYIKIYFDTPATTDETLLIETELASLKYLSDCFLCGNGLILRVSLDNNISSLSHHRNDVITDTIWGRFPSTKRYKGIEYRTFSLSCTISYQGNIIETNSFSQSENTFKHNEINMFRTKENILGASHIEESERIRAMSESKTVMSYHSRLPYYPQKDSDDFVLERKFLEAVTSFLTDGKPKLLSSSSEGNIMVYLSDIQIEPKNEVGRLICSFSATATEMSDCTIYNFDKYEIQSTTPKKISKYSGYDGNVYMIPIDNEDSTVIVPNLDGNGIVNLYENVG